VTFHFAFPPPLQFMSPVTLITVSMMIGHVHCSEWERMYDGTWRAEGLATIYLEDGSTLKVDRADVAKGTDLNDTLEAYCRTDLDGGMGDSEDN
jgi:hypothetical protein